MYFDDGSSFIHQPTQLHFNLDDNSPQTTATANRRNEDLILIEKLNGKKPARRNKLDVSNISDKLQLASRLAKLDVSSSHILPFSQQQQLKPTPKVIRPSSSLIKRKDHNLLKKKQNPKLVTRKPLYQAPKKMQYKIPKEVPHIQKYKMPKEEPRSEQFKIPEVPKKANHVSWKNRNNNVEDFLTQFERDTNLEHFSKKLRQIIKKEKLKQQRSFNQSLNSTFGQSKRLSPQKKVTSPKGKQLNKSTNLVKSKINDKPRPSGKKFIETIASKVASTPKSEKETTKFPQSESIVENLLQKLLDDGLAETSQIISEESLNQKASQISQASNLETMLQRIKEMENEETEIRQRWNRIDYGEINMNKTQEHGYDDEIRNGKGHNQAYEEEMASSLKPIGFEIIGVNPKRNSLKSKGETAQVCELPSESLDSILSGRKGYNEYLRRNNHEEKGNFNPWKIVDDLSDEIIKDITNKIVDVELAQVCDRLVERVITDEFAEPGQHRFSPLRHNSSSSAAVTSSSSFGSKSHGDGYDEESWEESGTATTVSGGLKKSEDESWQNLDSSFSTFTE